MAVLRIIFIVLKLLLLLVLLLALSPVIALWFFCKYRVYRFNLKRHLKKSGVPKAAAKELAHEMSPGKIWRSFKA